MIKVFRSPRVPFLFFEETGKCARGGLEFLCELGGLRCGLGELVSLRVYGLGSPRVVGVAAPRSDPLGSCIVEILRVSKAGM